MNLKEALNVIGGLSQPSKMPWWSYSIPATACKTGGNLAKIPGTVCHNCYALKNFYNMPAVKAALDRRLKAMDSPRFVEAFIVAITGLHARSRAGENRFRWFDSGDIQSVAHLTKINDIAKATPQIRYWLPTKEPGVVKKWRAINGDFSDNLTVRQSHPMVGGSFPDDHGMPFSTVDSKTKLAKQCNAPKQGNKCLKCDHCWNKEVKVVNYKEH